NSMISKAGLRCALHKSCARRGVYSVAIGFLLTSALAFALMSIFVRMAGDLPTLQKAFFRNIVSVVVAVYMLYKGGDGFSVQKRNRLALLVRAASGTAALAACYYSFDHMIIADATILAKIAPFFTLLFSAWLMKEKVRKVEWFVLTVVFVGCILVIKPSFDFAAMTPALIAAFSGLGTGVSVTMVRFLQLRGEKSETIVLAFSSFSCLLFLPSLLLGYVPMSWQQFAYLMGAGTAATIGQFSMSAAYKRAPSSVLSVFEYSQVLFSAVLGMIIFAQFPDAYSLLGYVIVIGASVIMAVYGKRKEEPKNDHV
ncbi:MAG TPA: DMT family transporter, partial [Clostridia bacterium]|nr:DMT family transporter [Clostridia bacterium]